VRHRYLVLTMWAAAWFLLATARQAPGLSDWLYFEFGARTLIHYNPHYGGGALHLYANHPVIQIGPPSLVIVAAVQWLPHNAAGTGFAALMALAGVWTVRSIDSTARALLPVDRHRGVAVMTACAGALAMPVWAFEAERWRHLDDVIAICLILAATSMVARRRSWWLAGLFVGVGVAAKPWALVLAPVLLGLARSERSKAAIVALASATACWAPFVVGGPGTLHALGGFPVSVSAASTLHLLGVHSAAAPSWVRPLQMVGGFLVMGGLARRSHWVAIPFAGLVLRVITDPQVWPYYGMGPVIAAVLWDCLHDRRWPTWTIATLAAEYAAPFLWPASSGTIRLLWALAVFASCLAFRGNRLAHTLDDEPRSVRARELEPAR
jgi:hypothetical protein